VKIRRADPADRESIWKVHVESVRVLCAGWYSSEQITVWTERLLPDSYRQAFERCEMVVAERKAEIVGFGQLDLGRAEVEAVYVMPTAVGGGVGTALLAHLETIARERGLRVLGLCASLNAEAFYAHRGYRARGREKHPLTAVMAVDCIRMEKALAA
jgi:GNAT superfamily N-acetyltransferase